MRRFRLNLPTFIILLVIAILVFFAWKIYMSKPPNMPFINADRDWVGVLGEIGKALGVVALIGLVYEISHRGLEAKKKSTPHLRVISAVVVEELDPTPDENNYFLHLGDSNNNLATSDYDQFNAFDSQTAINGNKYLKFIIENSSSYYEAAARSPEFNFSISYNNVDDFTDANSIATLEFSYCLKGISFFPNEKKSIYLRISPSPRLVPDRVFVKAIINKAYCYNLNNDHFNTKKVKFQIFHTDSHRLIDEETEGNIVEALRSISEGLEPPVEALNTEIDDAEDVVGSEDENIPEE